MPQLTDEEEDQLDQVIERFIQSDTGQLRGAEGKKALEEFQQLGPEATFALIRGLNRAANIEFSCPAVVIAKKLGAILNASNDPDLLDFARENIGMGVTKSRHMGVIKDLRVSVMLRKNAVARNTVVVKTHPSAKALGSMSVPDLVRSTEIEKGPRLGQVLVELEKRDGGQVIDALGKAAAATPEIETQELARTLLTKHLSRQDGLIVKERLKDDQAEVRAAAAQAAGIKVLRLVGSELIDLLNDDNGGVRGAARKALVVLSRGADYGPEPEAEAPDREAAIRKWRDWWAQQDGR